MEIKVKDYDYKHLITITKPFGMSRRRLEKKVKRILDNFPNYSMYWDGELFLIVNLYFDDTGWDKDRNNKRSSVSIDGNIVSIRWTER